MARANAGAVLLEAVVGLTILATAGLALAVAVQQALASAEQARAAELEVAEAASYMEAVTLWPRDDLERRLGDRRNGPWRLDIQRVEPGLYALLLRDSTGRRSLAATTVYRRIGSTDDNN